MDKPNKSFESIFQQKLEGNRVQPSPRVLRNIKRKLFVSDFFSLNYRKFNIGYVSFILAAFIVSSLLISKKDVDIASFENQEGKSNIINSNKHRSGTESYKESKRKSIIERESTGNKDEKLLLTAFYVPDILKGCVPLNVHFQNKSTNAKTIIWNFGNGEKSNTENPEYTFKTPGVYKVILTTINSEGLEANYEQTIKVYSKPEANFEIDNVKSDLNTKKIVFNNNSSSAKRYKWNFGDKIFSEEKDPEHVYVKFDNYIVSLVAISENGCTDTVKKSNSFIAKDYRLIFPLQFKPNIVSANNGDYERPENKSFVFYPKNSGVNKYHLVVLASNGIEVFSTSDIKKGWDGYVRGRIAQEGIYTYKAYGVYPNGQEFSLSGNVKLIVDDSFENYNNN